MELTDFSSGVIGRGSNGVMPVSYGDDHGLIVTFYMESVLQNAESEKLGRPIYKDEPYIWIRFPGDRNREIQRPVDLTGKRGNIPDNERFPKQWAAFQNKQQEVHDGTKIEEWGPISKSLALTLKGVNVHTVENLAAVPDSALHALGHGGREMREKAIAWLKATKDNAEVTKLAAENQRLRDDIEALKAQMAELGAKRKPGRPRKEEA